MTASIQSDDQIRCLLLSDKESRQDSFNSVDACLAAIEQHKGHAWLQIVDPVGHALLSDLLAALGIHLLTQEDIRNQKHRPNAEIFENYVFVCMRKAQVVDDGINYSQFSFVLKDQLLVTFHQSEDQLFDLACKRLQLDPAANKLKSIGSAYLAYMLLDINVDEYFTVLDFFEAKIDDQEDYLMTQESEFSLDKVYWLKRQLIAFRKIASPARDLAGTLLKYDHKLFPPKLDAYLRDLYDHSLRITESCDTQRELLSGLTEAYHTRLNNKMNESMRVLTIFATIFIPLTFIGSIYGMNFEFMPELKWHYGYFIVLGLMAVIAIILVIFFKRKRWL